MDQHLSFLPLPYGIGLPAVFFGIGLLIVFFMCRPFGHEKRAARDGAARQVVTLLGES